MRLTPADIQGVYSLLPIPGTADANSPSARGTVDVDKLAWFIENVISQGANGILLLATMGEIHTLMQDEYELVVRTAVEVVNRRVQLFCGTTTLNTRETIERTKFVMKAGADGILNGVPMWLPSSVDNAIQYYADIAEAVPDVAIMIYHQPPIFRLTIPPAAWARIAEIPNVIASKQAQRDLVQLMATQKAVGDRITMLPSDQLAYPMARLGFAKGVWSSRSAASPAPVVQLWEACKAQDWDRAAAIHQDIVDSWMRITPEQFHMYDTPLVKILLDEATGGKAGPVRPPFRHLPPELAEAAREAGRKWAALAEKYSTAPASRS